MLERQGAPVELSGRYLDALTLLVQEAGKLVSKDRFMQEVWHGVPVTDEALTQCIKTLRRQLGDSAGSPRFIETVPKHGYRFVAPVTAVDETRTSAAPEAKPPPAPALASPWRRFLLLGSAGTIGAGLAGLIGGILYGFAGASDGAQPGTGAASVLLVLTSLSILVALVGGAGVSFGIAASAFAKRNDWLWSTAGGAAGGMAVGATAKLLGLDAFNLLFGHTPGDITGAGEGALLGGVVGLAAWASNRAAARAGRLSLALAAAAGAIAGAAISLGGGRMMAGSLDLLARQFPGSRLRLDPIGGMFGEVDFGPISQAMTAALEGALFTTCIVFAILLANKSLREA